MIYLQDNDKDLVEIVWFIKSRKMLKTPKVEVGRGGNIMGRYHFLCETCTGIGNNLYRFVYLLH